MPRKYRSYKGRTSPVKIILLIIIAVVVAATVLLFLTGVLSISSDGLRFAGFRLSSDSPPTPSDDSTPTPVLVIGTPSPSPSPSATPTPSPSRADSPDTVRAVYLPDLSDSVAVNAACQLARDGVINSVVADMKHDDGTLGFISKNEIAAAVGANAESAAYRANLEKLIDEQLYVVARISVFKDNLLPRDRHEYSVQTDDGIIWLDQNYHGWMNPYSGDVLDYITGISAELVAMGFSEIMLDNFLFPTLGRPWLLYFPEEETTSRSDALDSFAASLIASINSAEGNVSFKYDYSHIAAVNPDTGINLGDSRFASNSIGLRNLNRVYVTLSDTGIQAEIESAGEVFAEIGADICAVATAPREYTDPSAGENISMLIGLIDSTDSVSGYVIYDSSGYYPAEF